MRSKERKKGSKPPLMSVEPKVAFADPAPDAKATPLEVGALAPAEPEQPAEAPTLEAPAPAAAPQQPPPYLHFQDDIKIRPFRDGRGRLVVAHTVNGRGKLYSYASLRISAGQLPELIPTMVPYRGGQVEGYSINHEQLLKLFAMVEYQAQQQGMERKDEEEARAPKHNRRASPSPTPTAPKQPTPAELVQSAISEIEQTKEAVEGLVKHYNEFRIMVSDEEKARFIADLNALKNVLDGQSVATVKAELEGTATPQIDVTGVLAGTKQALFDINYLISSRLAEALLKSIRETAAPASAKDTALAGIPALLSQAKTDFESGKPVEWGGEKGIRNRMVRAKNALLTFTPRKEHRRTNDNSRGDDQRSGKRQRSWR